jgi:putative heme iron utilization protein
VANFDKLPYLDDVRIDSEMTKDRSPAENARHLLMTVGKASLATLHPDQRRPYSSLVQVIPDTRGHLVMLLSDLADHTKNLTANGAASLMLDGTDGESLSGPRVSVEGEITKLTDPDDIQTMKAAFVKHHPEAQIYADYNDFNLYRMTIERLHLIAGFGRIHWLDAADVLDN